jgi:hypothetical protein
LPVEDKHRLRPFDVDGRSYELLGVRVVTSMSGA